MNNHFLLTNCRRWGLKWRLLSRRSVRKLHRAAVAPSRPLAHVRRGNAAGNRFRLPGHARNCVIGLISRHRRIIIAMYGVLGETSLPPANIWPLAPRKSWRRSGSRLAGRLAVVLRQPSPASAASRAVMLAHRGILAVARPRRARHRRKLPIPAGDVIARRRARPSGNGSVAYQPI